MAETAKVIRICGSGAERLQAAIKTGLLTTDAVRACNEVIDENKRLRKENRLLKERLAVVQESRRNERRDRAEAYRMVLAKDSEYQRARDWRVAKNIGLLALGGLAVALITVAALL